MGHSPQNVLALEKGHSPHNVGLQLIFMGSFALKMGWFLSGPKSELVGALHCRVRGSAVEGL